MNRKVYLGLGLLCAIWAVGMMITVVTIQGNYVYADAFGYISIAQSLLETGSRYGVHEYRTPGYPLFLAIDYFLFGKHTFSVQMIQILIGAATIFLVGVMTLRIAGMVAAFVAALFFLLNLSFNALVVSTITDALGMSIFALFFLCAIQVIHSPILSNRKLFWSGFFLSLAIFVRPFFYYLFWLILPAVIVLLWWQNVSWNRIARNVICFVFPWLVIIGSVYIRNAIVLGELQYSTISRTLPPFFIATILEKDLNNHYQEEWVANTRLIWHKPCAGLNNPEPCFALGNPNWDIHSKKVLWMYIMENPFQTLRSLYINKLDLFKYPAQDYFLYVFPLDIPSPSLGYKAYMKNLFIDNRSWYIFGNNVYDLVFLLCSFAVPIFWIIIKRRHLFIAIFILIIFSYVNSVLIFSLTNDFQRYRVPIVPIQSMLAGIGFAAVFFWARKGWENLRKRFVRNASL